MNSYSSSEIWFRYYVLWKMALNSQTGKSGLCLGPHSSLKITIVFTCHTILKAGTMYYSTLYPQGVSILPGTSILPGIKPQKSCDPIPHKSISLFLFTHTHTTHTLLFVLFHWKTLTNTLTLKQVKNFCLQVF